MIDLAVGGWVNIAAPIAVGLICQLILLAAFVGSIRTELRAVKEEVSKLIAARLEMVGVTAHTAAQIERFEECRKLVEKNQEKLAAHEARMNEMSEGGRYLGRRLDELFRTVGELARTSPTITKTFDDRSSR